MSVDDQSDVWRELREMKRKIARLESGSMLENSSITRGRMRFIGGTLRVDSGGRVEIVGTLHVEGTTQFVGPVTISGSLDITGDTTVTGQFDVDGPWGLNGDGDITGDVNLTGSLDVTGGGNIEVGNVLIDPQNGGRVVVQQGGRFVARSNDTGKPDIRIMNGDIEFGDSYIAGTGGTLSMTGRPVSGGAGAATVNAGLGFANLRMTGGGEVRVNGTGVQMSDLPDLPTGTTARYVVQGDDGYLYRTAGTGGGGPGVPGPVAGDFMWPFDPSTTHPVLGVYGMRLNPVTGLWAMHNGQDFSVPGGSPIPSAGDGQVAAKGFDGGRGNYIVIDHGGGVTTHYFHMQAASPLSVGANVDMGDTIGAVGTTGSSTGNHLHWEVHMNGSPVDPAAFMAAQG